MFLDSINKRRQSVCPSVGFPRPKSIGARLEYNNENEIATRQQRRWTMLQSPLPTTVLKFAAFLSAFILKNEN